MEDVTIRCRVRRSPHATNPKFEEAVEMTCAMKNWDACALAKNRSNGIRGPLSYSLPQRAVSAPHPSRTPTPPSRQGLPNGLSMSMNGGRVAPQNYGPELLLTPLREILTNWDDSPIQRRVSIHNNSQHQQQSSAYAYSIPISDVMIVDTANPHSSSASPGRKSLTRHHGSAHSSSTSSSCQIFITTFSYGLLDFQCQHQNGLDILMAFLKASLPPERILDRAKYLQNHSSYEESSSLDSVATTSDNDDPGRPRDPNAQRRRGRRKSKGSAAGGPTIRSSSSVTSCLDVDTFTAVHLKGRAEHETWPEKMTRRVGHVVNSLSDLSSACCDGSWCLSSSSLPADDERDDHPRSHSHPHHSSATSMRHVPTTSTKSALRHGSAVETSVAVPAASNNSNNDRQPSPPKQPHKDPASRTSGYSDLELDEQESQLPGDSGASANANPSDPRSNTPPSTKVDRRWNSMPNAKRLELSRKSSC